MGNNEPGVDQSDLRIRGSYGLNTYIFTHIHVHVYMHGLRFVSRSMK